MKQLQNILCDRDGTIIRDRHYLSDPAGVELLPGASVGLQKLAQAGALIFVVTNQSGIGRGMFSVNDYQACANKMEQLLSNHGVTVAGSTFCPHAPAENGESACLCRKPAPGMWLKLKELHGLTSKNSVMIGDKPEDIAFGLNLGFAESILVLTGKGEKSALALGLPLLPEEFAFIPLAGSGPESGAPTCLARDLNAAADYLLTKYFFPNKGR